MDHTQPADLSTEVERYLAVVELYRAEGCPPCWRPETRGDEPNADSSSVLFPVQVGGERPCS